MASVLQTLLRSPLAREHELSMIVSWRDAPLRARIRIFVSGLVALGRFCLTPGTRIVHVHTTVRGSLYRKGVFVVLGKALRRPVILHVHSGVGDIVAFDARLGRVRRALLRHSIARADRVLSVSAAGASEIERRFGRAGIEIVPNAAPVVEAGEDDPGDERVQALFLGGFDNLVKGGRELLEALPAILAEPGPAPLVVMAGPGVPPAGAERVLRGDGVRWAGWLDGAEKERALSRSEIFLLPSLSEGLPVALLEAMAHGRAVVASRVGGIPEVMTDDTDGVLVPPGDPARLAEAVRALAADPERRARLGRAARERARRLNEDEVSGRLDTIYRELAAPVG